MEDGHSFTKDWKTEDGIPYKCMVRLLSQDEIHHFCSPYIHCIICINDPYVDISTKDDERRRHEVA